MAVSCSSDGFARAEGRLPHLSQSNRAWPMLSRTFAQRRSSENQDVLTAGLRVGGLRGDVPCLDRAVFDFVVVGPVLFASGGATAVVAALGLLRSRAVSAGGALAACGAVAAFDAAAGGTD